MKVDSPNSVHEKEAASVADKVSKNGQLMGSENSMSGQISGNPNPKNGMIAPAGMKERINSTKGSGDKLPDSARRMVKGKTGELDDVRIHTDSTAAELAESVNANAFAVGRDIYFGKGKFNTYTSDGNELLAHEIAHTKQETGNSESLIRRSVINTNFGSFEDKNYAVLPSTDPKKGVSMTLYFHPGEKVTAGKIGMMQSVKAVNNGKDIYSTPDSADRVIGSGPGAGYSLDRVETMNNPIYGSMDLPSGQGLDQTNERNPGFTDQDAPGKKSITGGMNTYSLGHRNSATDVKDAWLFDEPGLSTPIGESSMTFETTAMALDGAMKGTFLGSVSWGWSKSKNGDVKKKDLKLVSASVPSANFIQPAAAWNATKTLKKFTIARDTKFYDPVDINTNQPLTQGAMLLKGYEVNYDGGKSTNPKDSLNYNMVTYGKYRGLVKTEDLLDTNTGNETIDIPGVDKLATNNMLSPHLSGYTKRAPVRANLGTTKSVSYANTYYSGMDYVIAVGAGYTDKNVHWTLADDTGKVVYDNANEDYASFFEFNMASTLNLTVNASLRNSTNDNYVTILSGYKAPDK